MKETRNKAYMVAFLGSILAKGVHTAFDAQPGLFTGGFSYHTVIKPGTQSISFNSVRSTLMIEWLGAVLIDVLLQVESLQS